MRRIVLASSVLALAASGSMHSQQTPAAAARWAQTAYIKAAAPAAGDHFADGGALPGHDGAALALSGDGRTLAAGAPHESGGGVFSAGAVYVYTRSGASWTQQAMVKAAHPGQSDTFGRVVALSQDGSTMAVAAVGEASRATGVNGDQADDSIPQSGAVYIFTRRGTAWTQQAYLKASNTGEAGTADSFGDGDQFGFSLALSRDGNTVAVGAITEDSGATGINGNQADNSKQSAGAVYVFARQGTTWAQQAYVKPSSIDAGDLFGYAVALSADGDTLAASSYDEDGGARAIDGPIDNARNGAGAVFLFTRSGRTWQQSAYVKHQTSELGDSWGVAVALSDDGRTLAVAALDEDCPATGVNPPRCGEDGEFASGTSPSMGAIGVFVRRGSSWTEQAYLKASNTGREDWFGARLALSGDGNTIAATAHMEDSSGRGIDGMPHDNSANEAGAAYVFTRTGAAWRHEAYVKASNTDAFDEFGSSVALSRDGLTLAVGARGEDSAAAGINGNQADNSAAEAGAAYVFERSAQAATAAAGVPRFEYDPAWPKLPLPNEWIMGEVGGIGASADGHVWVIQRPWTVIDRELAAITGETACCRPAPPVIEFDAAGNVLQAWPQLERFTAPAGAAAGQGVVVGAGGAELWQGGKGAYGEWGRREHTVLVDHNNFVWVSNDDSHVVYKFTREGKHLLTIGRQGVTRGSNDTAHLGRPAGLAVDPQTNELFVADGYTNKRVIVFDAATGAYRRHWGAYGKPPEDAAMKPYDPKGPPDAQFRGPVHGITLSRDGLVYVSDRTANRVQVFRRSGEFVREGFVARETLDFGSAYGVALSQDARQQWLYVSDGSNNRIWILRRDTLETVGGFSSYGRQGGQVLSAHSLTVDPQGNIYVAETRGRRVQKFRLVR